MTALPHEPVCDCGGKGKRNEYKAMLSRLTLTAFTCCNMVVCVACGEQNIVDSRVGEEGSDQGVKECECAHSRVEQRVWTVE